MVLPDAGPIVPFVRPRTPKRGEQGQGLPDLGLNQFIVTFPYPMKLHQSFFLADPVWAPQAHRGLHKPTRAEPGDPASPTAPAPRPDVGA